MPARTPLHDRHLAAGARLVEFGGYEMPLQYSTMREEHVAVRERAGLFDLSHMGEVRISGADAQQEVQRLVANDVSRLAPGYAQYAVMCNGAGGIVDDVVVYRDDEGFTIVVNAACHDKDIAWMQSHVGGGVTIADESVQTALLALQGPRAMGILQPLTDLDLGSLRSFRHRPATVAGVPARVSRTGYTGEDGTEIFVDAPHAAALWDALIASGRSAGLLPAGLGARDTLRLEAGLRLYGQDMDESVDPYSCGLGWTVRRRQGDFIGAEALAAIDHARPPRRFTGLSLGGRAIARHGNPVRIGDSTVGEVTSGTFSFTLGHGIATAYLSPDLDATDVVIAVRDTDVPASVVPLPFYRRSARGD